MPKINTEAALDAFIEEFQANDQTAVQAASAWQKYKAGWRPKLNPIQNQAFEDRTAVYVLFYGERGSGKTMGALHKLVDHCFNNLNAVAFIIVREAGQAKDGGAWDKLIDTVLPTWKNGNYHPKTHEKYDEGIGLEYSKVTLDYETKKPAVWITNRYGQGSKIVCFSLPVGAHVEDKIKGREPSMVLVDEAQTTNDEGYFTHIVQQVGRRHDIEYGAQQIIYCANPDGPSHWLYKRFFIAPVNQETGDWNDDYAVYHVPIAENLDNLPDGYYDRVIEACRGNDTMYRRMVLGEWVDMPTGQAMFKGVFVVSIHVRGDLGKSEGLVPITNHVIIWGYDLGPAHTSIHAMQCLTRKDGKIIWPVFDELNFVGQYMRYSQIVPQLLARMDYWCKLLDHQFTFEHIADDSAFNQLRPDGSWDAMEFERLSLGRVKMRGAPKGAGSVQARVRMFMEMLQLEEVLISATCPKTVDMLLNLESQPMGKDHDMTAGLTPNKGSPHRHVLDSLTYPIWTYRTSGRGVSVGATRKVDSALVVFGEKRAA